MSLARLLHGQGRDAAGRDSLAAACASFTEGFDTGDLVEAQALLEALGTSSAGLANRWTRLRNIVY
jgi:predicted ATPase